MRETASDLGRVAWPQRSRAARAAEHLSLLASRVAPGDRLGTKSELRAECAVSVGTFNEALKLAEAHGRIVLRRGPGGGLFAAVPSPMVQLGNSMLALDNNSQAVQAAIRIRDALDPLLVEDALEHATRQDLSDLETHVIEMRTAVDEADPLRFVHANWSLHRSIALASTDVMLRTIYVNLLDLVEGHTVSVQPAGPTSDSLMEYVEQRFSLHRDLVRSITTRDRVNAMRLIAEHQTTSNPVPGLGLSDPPETKSKAASMENPVG